MTTFSDKLDDNYIEPEIMELIDFIGDKEVIGTTTVTPQKIDKNFDKIGKALNTLIAYPDLLIDIITPEDSSFSLFFYQRIILRSNARHKQCYTVATRAASKTFLAFISRYFAAMELPNHHTFICAPVKKQTAEIAREKIQEDLWIKFPLLKNEMIKLPQPGKKPKDPYVVGGDYATYYFSNGSVLDVIGSNIRGGRRHSGDIEEVIDHDATYLNEKVIPLMNVARRTCKGVVNPNEPNAAKIYTTTAGYAGTFAYEKFIESLIYTAIDPDNYMTISMTYKIPLMHGLLDAHNLREVISSPSFDRDSFEREYESKWSKSYKGAAFNYDLMRRVRKIQRAELRSLVHLDKTGNSSEDFYVISADMAKDGNANTSVVVLRIRPKDASFLYKVVNAFKIDSTDYKVVSDELKQAILAYDARMMIYDANGIGASLRDWLNKPSISLDGQMLPGLGIINPPAGSEKDVIKYPPTETICYEIKASGGNISGQIHRLFFGRIKSGTIKLLISKREALEKFKKNKGFINATLRKQKQALQPYIGCDMLEEELLNLDVAEVTEGGAAILKVVRRNTKIQKDFFSALEYGIYGVHEHIELPYYKRKRKKKSKYSDFIRFSDI